MKFVRRPKAVAVTAMTASLHHALRREGATVWLVSGGSAIEMETAVMKNLSEQCPELLDDLTILPIDERYGPEGHTDSNYAQLLDAGFRPGEAHWHDILTDSLPLAETVDYYVDIIEEAFGQAHYIIGSFGMGADGHTAGILPHSPAVKDTEAVVVGYSGPDFTRMTLTPSVLARCNEGYLLAYGETKADALTKLEADELTLEEMPALLLHHIENMTVYNDYINTGTEEEL